MEIIMFNKLKVINTDKIRESYRYNSSYIKDLCDAYDEQAKEIERLVHMAEKSKILANDLINCGVIFQDERVDYVEMQIPKVLLSRARSFLFDLKGM